MKGPRLSRALHLRNTAPALLLALGAAACSSGLPRNGQAHDPKEALQAQAFMAHCSICHAPPHPKRHTYAEWKLLLPIMEQRMQERGMGRLPDSDRAAILSYLEANSR
jgi:hypothetical protein